MDIYIRYYFLGIGGIGMSAIARYFNTKGFAVAGYDRSETKLTIDLQTKEYRLLMMNLSIQFLLII